MKKIYSIFGANGRVLFLRFLARLHCGLISACLCATAFAAMALVGWADADAMLPFYLRGLLFGVPVALSYYAAERLPRLWQFLIAVVVIIGTSWLLLGHIGGAIMAALLCLFRFRNRISEEKTRSSFDAPSYVCLLIFLACFGVSAVYELSALQRLTVLSAVLYLLLILTYRAVERIEGYLKLNKSMKELPARRIQRIAGAAVAIFLVLAVVFLIPSVLSMQGNIVLDLPDVPGKPYTGPEEVGHISGGMNVNIEDLLGDEGGEPLFKIPSFVIYLVYTLIAAAVAAMIIYGIYQLVKNFRFPYSDNRDIIESLPKDTDAAADLPTKRRERLSIIDRSPNAVIRRKYRKTVLKSAAEPPKRWMTPTELEGYSGISEQNLHNIYEKARYGAAPCTAEDVRALRVGAAKE